MLFPFPEPLLFLMGKSCVCLPRVLVAIGLSVIPSHLDELSKSPFTMKIKETKTFLPEMLKIVGLKTIKTKREALLPSVCLKTGQLLRQMVFLPSFPIFHPKDKI